MVPLTLVTARVGAGTGTGGVVAAVAAVLRARGADVVIEASTVDGPTPGIRVVPRGAGGPGRLRVAFDREPGAEIVRASGGVHAAWRWVGADTAWRRLRAALPAERSVEAREREAFARARVVIANAEKVARELLLFHGLGADRVSVVRTGVDLDRFRPDAARRRAVRAARGARGRVAVFLGHGWRRKGLDTALAAFARAAGPDDALWVLGRDAQAAAWRARCRDPRVWFGGAVDPAAWLPAADAVLAPSRYDAASNAVLEALACGAPPVVSLADGAAEVVSERRLCVASPTDVNGFADALRQAWEDGDLPGRCRGDAERWPVSRMVDGLAALVDGCARRGTMSTTVGAGG